MNSSEIKNIYDDVPYIFVLAERDAQNHIEGLADKSFPHYTYLNV